MDLWFVKQLNLSSPLQLPNFQVVAQRFYRSTRRRKKVWTRMGWVGVGTVGEAGMRTISLYMYIGGWRVELSCNN